MTLFASHMCTCVIARNKARADVARVPASAAMMVPNASDNGAPGTRGVRAACAPAVDAPLTSAPPLQPRLRPQNFIAVNLVAIISVVGSSYLFVTLLRRRRILHI